MVLKFNPLSDDGFDLNDGNQGPQGIQGPQGLQGDTGAVGPQGPAGAAAGALELTAGEDILLGKVLVIDDGLAYKAESSDMNHLDKVIGVAAASTSIVDLVPVTASGIVEKVGWGLTVDAEYYANADGEVTSTPPTSGWIQRIGVAISATELLVDLGIPYDLSEVEVGEVVPTNKPTIAIILSGEALSAGAAVVINGVGRVVYASSGNASHAGKVAGIVAETVSGAAIATKVVTAGPVACSAWAFTPGEPVFMNTAGSISHTVPGTGFVRQVGVAFGTDQLLVANYQPTILA